MPKKTGFTLLMFIAAIAIIALIMNIQQNSISGAAGFTASGAGRGQYYQGPQIVQFSPEGACNYMGYYHPEKIEIKAGFGGSAYTKCINNQNGLHEEIWVPLIQLINFNR